jgi:predicted Zn-dependent protease
MRLWTAILASVLACTAFGTLQEEKGEAVQQPTVDKQHEKNIEADKKLGEDVAKEIAKQVEFSENKEHIARLERIGKEVADVANSMQVQVTWGDARFSKFDYKFFVIKGEDINAFSVPGGYIYFYEGLIEFAESDDELAGVVAHEIAHASLRHIAWMQKEQKSLDLLQLGAILAAIWSPRDAGKILIPAQLAVQGVQSGWSVRAERAADYAGLQYMQKTKYNPLGALTFMERLSYRDRFKPEIDWGILQTHPPSEERAKTLVAELKKIGVPIHRSSVTTSLKAVNKIGDQGIELWFGETKIHVFSGDNAQMRADRATDHLNDFFDRVPALYELSVRDDRTLVGGNRRLFDVEEADAEATGTAYSAAVDQALQALKKAVFDLGYRVWATRGSA